MGEQAIPILLELVKTKQDVAIKASAAQALGNVVAKHGSSIDKQVDALNAQITSSLISVLKVSDDEVEVQIEIVKALGRVPDQRSIEPLESLRAKAWTSSSTHPKFRELRDAIENSIWQLNPGAGGYE